jgi:hypothetical protein
LLDGFNLTTACVAPVGDAGFLLRFACLRGLPCDFVDADLLRFVDRVRLPEGDFAVDALLLETVFRLERLGAALADFDFMLRRVLVFEVALFFGATFSV